MRPAAPGYGHAVRKCEMITKRKPLGGNRARTRPIPGPGYVVAIGSGVGENIYEIDDALTPGSKHIALRRKLIGGSGINYTFRLMSMGIPVIPVLTVGRDILGAEIQAQLRELWKGKAPESRVEDYLADDRLFCEEVATPESTIIVNGESRTIVTEKLSQRSLDALAEHIVKRVDDVLEDGELRIKAVMIGHIYGEDRREGRVTRAIIDRVRARGSIKVFANFGLSQIRLGAQHWSEYLKKIDVFQLSLDEAREFFRKQKSRSLQSVLQWFKNNGIAAVKGRDAVVLAWPFELGSRLVDSTGAGDAFGSGLVSAIIEDGYSDDDVYTPIVEARRWAAHACTTVGGASDCPDREQLSRFVLGIDEFASVRVSAVDEVQLILRLLDKAC